MKLTKNVKAKSAVLLIFAVFSFSCKKSKSSEVIEKEEINLSSSAYNFYYFTDGFYKKVEKPSEVPLIPAKPWTEAVRISSISSAAFTNEGGSGVAKAFAVVNRCGILALDDSNIEFNQDFQLFNGRTAGNLVFYEDTPVYSLYRSTFFNDLEWSRKDIHPFLVQFNDEQKISYPLINVENLGLDETTEITDYLWDGKSFVCSAKGLVNGKYSFSYWNFQPKEHLLSVTPESARENLLIREVDVSDFRNAQRILPYEKAPLRVKELLGGLKSSDFILTVNTAGGHSPRRFIKSAESMADANPIFSYALLAENYVLVLFQDGTLFVKGALPERTVFNSGKTVVLRLPKLPQGFSYTGSAVSGGHLYASWEETDFYKTARSGFISVNLEKILY